MYSVYDYCTMVARDDVRRDAYLQALQRVVTADSVVIDLGAGIGIFSIAAAKMGAKHVYAMEENPNLELGREIAKAAGVADRITFLRASAWDVTLPERASVLFYDLRGTLPLYQDNFGLVAHAKERWLLPGAVHFPARDTLHAAVVSAPGCYANLERAVGAVRALGLSDHAVRRCIMNARTNDRDTPIAPEDVLTEHMTWGALEYGATPPKNLSGRSELAVVAAGTAHGIAVWFQTELLPGIGYDTAPGRTPTYSRAFLPFMAPLELHVGDKVTVDLRALVDGSEWGWSVAVVRSDLTTVRPSKQSTMLAALLPMDEIMQRASGANPRRNERGERVLQTLTAMDGTHTVDSLAGTFPAASDLERERVHAEIAAIVRRYGR